MAGTIITTLEHYLCEVLGVRSTAQTWKACHGLPSFLNQFYEFYEISLLEHRCLLMVAREGYAVTPAVIKKQWAHMRSTWAGYCVYVQKTITPYNRKRLIHHRVPFIIPDSQMYLPGLGVDFRESYPQPKTNKDYLSPSTQAIILYALCHDMPDHYTTSTLLQKLAYSRMTLIRSFNELEGANIGKVDREGKERCWSFRGTKRELWIQAMPLFRDPVKRHVWIAGGKPKIIAGLSALAARSMLSDPAVPIYATSVTDWKRWRKSDIEVLPISEGATAELQIWHYDPKLVADENIADPFSTYMSLKDTTDERVEAALEEMMENIKW